MKPITCAAFAVFLAVATLAGGNARAEFSVFGECITATENNPFDGETALVFCFEDVTHFILTQEIAVRAVAVRCANNTTELAISDGNKRISKEGLSLRTALDDTETPAWNWETRAGSGGLHIFPAIPIIKEMLRHSRFRFRITEGNGEQHNIDIDISGLGEAIKPVRKLCGW